MNAVFSQIKKHFPLFIFLTFYFLLFAYKLISNPAPFYDWDESIYAEVGREMVEKGSLTPLWQYQTWLDKPPLVPLFYGVLMKLTPFIAPEISTRIATLFIATVALGFVYILYFKVIKETWLATLVVVLTSFTSIILQRALVLNIDIFLLIGWLGYVLFYDRFKVSLFFLAVAVLSKSLIGFYAPGIMTFYFLYLFITKQIDKKELIKQAKTIAFHVGIMVLWYFIMFAIYGNAFIIQHVYESHMKRVTASIETHFGRREYYITLLYEYFGALSFISIAGISVILWQWYNKALKIKEVLYALYLLPWFLFLNVTKTKIFWYSHPYIPQFAFLILYPLILAKKLPFRVYSILLAIVSVSILWHFLYKERVYTVQYATRESHHDLAIYASSRCEKLYMLMNPTERKKIEDLESMDLTITTTTWWGQHPSMVYYFGKKIDFMYKLEDFNAILKNNKKNDCLTVTDEDKNRIIGQNNLSFLQQFGSVYLYKFKVE